MTLIRAVDISAWQGDPGGEWWKTLHDKHGITLAVLQRYGSGPLGTRFNPHFDTHLTDALFAGMDIFVYYAPPVGVLQDQPGAFDSGVVWLDVEAGYAVRANQVDWAKRFGLPGIYTSFSAWNEAMGASQEFSGLPLWDAYYMQNKQTWTGWWPENLTGGLKYGGWNTPGNLRVGWQFAGDVTVEGRNCDLSVFSKEWIDSIMVTPEQVDAKIKAAFDFYNKAHFEDDHLYLGIYRDAYKLLRRPIEEAERERIVRGMAAELRQYRTQGSRFIGKLLRLLR